MVSGPWAAVAAVLTASCLLGCQAQQDPSTDQHAGAWTMYADVDGDSSVQAFQSGPGFINVRFSDGSVYLYTDASAGPDDVSAMQQLAAAGDGLGSYIYRFARFDYAERIR